MLLKKFGSILVYIVLASIGLGWAFILYSTAQEIENSLPRDLITCLDVASRRDSSTIDYKPFLLPFWSTALLVRVAAIWGTLVVCVIAVKLLLKK